MRAVFSRRLGFDLTGRTALSRCSRVQTTPRSTRRRHIPDRFCCGSCTAGRSSGKPRRHVRGVPYRGSAPDAQEAEKLIGATAHDIESGRGDAVFRELAPVEKVDQRRIGISLPKSGSSFCLPRTKKNNRPGPKIRIERNDSCPDTDPEDPAKGAKAQP
jgi:hypothetical protein